MCTTSPLCIGRLQQKAQVAAERLLRHPMTSVYEKEVGAWGLLALLLQLPLNPSVGRAHSAYSQRSREERIATDVRLTLLCRDALTSLF